MNLVVELVEWWQALPADFAFLLALPFVVGAAGLWAERGRDRGKEAQLKARRRKPLLAP